MRLGRNDVELGSSSEECYRGEGISWNRSTISLCMGRGFQRQTDAEVTDTGQSEFARPTMKEGVRETKQNGMMLKKMSEVKRQWRIWSDEIDKELERNYRVWGKRELGKAKL